MVYDIIITGSGCAGLSLVHHLLRSSMRDKSILLIDSDTKTRNDRTWCFWQKEEPGYRSALQHSWDTLSFHDGGQETTQSIAPYRYYHIRSDKFYQEVFQLIGQAANTTFQLDQVQDIDDQGDEVVVTCRNQSYRARQVFNSIPIGVESRPQPGFLKQHFYGWFIEFDQDILDDKSVRLMDFRADNSKAPSFFYLLPFSKTRALVEFTQFSHQLLSEVEYEQELKYYLQNDFGGAYRILEREQGVIPMTNFRFKTHPSSNVMNIGTAGGFTKPTTGYTFRNIQVMCKQIVARLESGSSMQAINPYRPRFNFYDQLLLHIISHQPHLVHKIMGQLFRRNSFRKILRFLDEQSNPFTEIGIFSRLPWPPFIRALIANKAKKRKASQALTATSSVTGALS